MHLQSLLQEAYTLQHKNSIQHFLQSNFYHLPSHNDFCASGFRACGLDIDKLRDIVDQELSRLPKVTGGQISVDQFISDIFKRV